MRLWLGSDPPCSIESSYDASNAESSRKGYPTDVLFDTAKRLLLWLLLLFVANWALLGRPCARGTGLAGRICRPWPKRLLAGGIVGKLTCRLSLGLEDGCWADGRRNGEAFRCNVDRVTAPGDVT